MTAPTWIVFIFLELAYEKFPAILIKTEAKRQANIIKINF